MKKKLISPSILNADFSKLGEECLSLRNCGADWLHCDIMDGHFVPNISFGGSIVRCVKSAVPDATLDVHLMVERPLKYAKDFAEAGADLITFHIEALDDIVETASLIKSCGCKVGIAVKPSTPIEKILPFSNLADLVLVMTVEPGFGGQSFMPECLEKVSAAHAYFSNKFIEVDGGINEKTGKLAVEAGANVLVAGTYLVNAKDRLKAFETLKNL